VPRDTSQRSARLRVDGKRLPAGNWRVKIAVRKAS
jgi:hypothetical protein